MLLYPVTISPLLSLPDKSFYTLIKPAAPRAPHLAETAAPFATLALQKTVEQDNHIFVAFWVFFVVVWGLGFVCLFGFSFNNQNSTTHGVGKLQCEEHATEIVNCSLIFSKSCISLNTVVSRPDSSNQMKRDHNQIK